MAKTLIIDELHMTFRIPSDLPDDEADAIPRALDGDEFLNRLRRAIRAVVRSLPELSAVRVALTR
jgi:hypothetical protein